MLVDESLDGLTPAQENAIIALLEEPTVAKAAERTDVPQSTLYRWLKEPNFARVYRESRREGFRHAISLTQRFAPLATNTLARILTDPDAPASAKVSAAVALLKFSRESIELDDVVGRVEALEQAAQPGASRWP